MNKIRRVANGEGNSATVADVNAVQTGGLNTGTLPSNFRLHSRIGMGPLFDTLRMETASVALGNGFNSAMLGHPGSKFSSFAFN